jgi:hypothetical protein
VNDCGVESVDNFFLVALFSLFRLICYPFNYSLSILVIQMSNLNLIRYHESLGSVIRSDTKVGRKPLSTSLRNLRLLVIKNINNRMFSTSSVLKVYETISSEIALQEQEKSKFFEWFVGFTDGEGCFSISKISPRQDYIAYRFNFRITLHVDDTPLLHQIRDTLGFGKVMEFKSKNCSSYTVNKREDISQLIKIFENYPLQSVKLLNFLDFKKAFEIYTSSPIKTSDIKEEIVKISDGLNRKRTIFEFPDGHKIQITSY